VKSKTGIPFLKDIPVLGLLFSTETVSVKRSILAVAGECIMETPTQLPGPPNRSRRELH
jgi:hypothetical protein